MVGELETVAEEDRETIADLAAQIVGLSASGMPPAPARPRRGPRSSRSAFAEALAALRESEPAGRAGAELGARDGAADGPLS